MSFHTRLWMEWRVVRLWKRVWSGQQEAAIVRSLALEPPQPPSGITVCGSRERDKVKEALIPILD